ncbi:hypothetical protein PVAP13_9NG484028 [Panicum virgatum]|uniref:Uncharacterized protein n=1 Tax=Panicum virgatum TaxID=38727 RepID=A0A8T0MVT2_PANVG|nr:hypothetical protein PVAP13_9NG484028 [Panicum virgatum]
MRRRGGAAPSRGSWRCSATIRPSRSAHASPPSRIRARAGRSPACPEPAGLHGPMLEPPRSSTGGAKMPELEGGGGVAGEGPSSREEGATPGTARARGTRGRCRCSPRAGREGVGRDGGRRAAACSRREEGVMEAAAPPPRVWARAPCAAVDLTRERGGAEDCRKGGRATGSKK